MLLYVIQSLIVLLLAALGRRRRLDLSANRIKMEALTLKALAVYQLLFRNTHDA